MNSINSAFFNVCKLILNTQGTFIKYAYSIGRAIFLIAFAMAIINYAINGTGLKDSLIKIGKALFFFFIFIKGYPAITNKITELTYNAARTAVWTGAVETAANGAKTSITNTVKDQLAGSVEEKKKTFAFFATTSPKVSPDKDPDLYDMNWLSEVKTKNGTYAVVAPAALMQTVLLVAGECLRASDEAPRDGILPDIGLMLKCLICAFFVIATGAFAVFEYVIAFLEFTLVASVGIVVFPFCLWDGTKFISEKFLGALLGFTMKLLFCNICIFLMIYGLVILANGYTKNPFTGRADELITVVFSCLLYYFICKQGPNLAQSLLTGSPTLNAAGAIASSAAALGGAAAVAGMGLNAGMGAATGGAKMIGAGKAAAGAAKDGGGGLLAQAGAALGAGAKSAGQGMLKGAGNLTRSLMARDPTQKLFNPNGQFTKDTSVASFANKKNEDGSSQGFGQHFKDAFQNGKDSGNKPGQKAGVTFGEGKGKDGSTITFGDAKDPGGAAKGGDKDTGKNNIVPFPKALSA